MQLLPGTRPVIGAQARQLIGITIGDTLGDSFRRGNHANKGRVIIEVAVVEFVKNVAQYRAKPSDVHHDIVPIQSRH